LLGNLAFKLGVSVDEVTNAGIALAFVTFPQAVSLLPLSNVFSLILFLSIFLLGYSSGKTKHLSPITHIYMRKAIYKKKKH
jgi:neurotransmitter:Na+ symporter, NSS family